MNKSTRERIDKIMNKKIGRLTVTGWVEVPDRKGTRVKLVCQCECGNTSYPTLSKLESDTSSCGCLRREKMRKAFFARKGNKKISEMTILDWK